MTSSHSFRYCLNSNNRLGTFGSFSFDGIWVWLPEHQSGPLPFHHTWPRAGAGRIHSDAQSTNHRPFWGGRPFVCPTGCPPPDVNHAPRFLHSSSFWSKKQRNALGNPRVRIGAFTLPDLRLWSVYEFGSSRSDGYSLSAIPYDRRCR